MDPQHQHHFDNKAPAKYQTPFERTLWPPTPASTHQPHQSTSNSTSTSKNEVSFVPLSPPLAAAPATAMNPLNQDASTSTPSSIATASETPSSIVGMSHSSREKLERMQALLSKTLGPEYLSQRQGGGGNKLTYIEGWKAINLANEIFGFNGWYTSIKELNVDFIDFNEVDQRYSIGVSAIVQVRLPDGAFHEDVGYGMAENIKSKGSALDKCKKEAVTDALKRCLRNFGNLLGNCIYDKHYIAEMGKMKAPKPKIDFKNIHRPVHDQELAEKAAKQSTENVAPAPPLQEVKMNVASNAQTPMRAPAAPVRAATMGATVLQRNPVAAPKLIPGPAAGSSKQQNETVSAASMLNSGPHPVVPRFEQNQPPATPSDSYSIEDDSAMISVDLNAYPRNGEVIEEGDSGFAEGGLSMIVEPDTRSKEEYEALEKKRLMESKRQAAMQKRQKTSQNAQQQHHHQQQQQQQQRSPPNLAGMQRSKTLGNPSTMTSRPVVEVQAGKLPVLNVGSRITELGGAAVGGGFASTKGVKRTLVDE